MSTARSLTLNPFIFRFRVNFVWFVRGAIERGATGAHTLFAKDGAPMMKTSLLGSMLLGSVLLVGACATGDDVSSDPTVDSSEQDVAASGSGCAQVSIITARASTEAAG